MQSEFVVKECHTSGHEHGRQGIGHCSHSRKEFADRVHRL